MERFIRELKRTHYAGTLRGEHAGQDVVLMGWVGALRNHGGCIFVDLRDRTGFVQVRLDPQVSPEAVTVAESLRMEDVVAVRGPVVSRGENINLRIPTGEVEVEGARLERLSAADTPPFKIADEVDATEVLRLKYRYLDLRRAPLQRNLILRHRVTQATRASLTGNGFLELETPILNKSTPEGARDYLVPSRIHPGHFYALPQSPQLFKQLFMVAGFDRYFQISRCFRDEDLRADRQPEFTQIDLELSFADEEDVFQVVEELIGAIWTEARGAAPQTPFPRLPWAEAMARYGSDKPDLRFGLEMVDLGPALQGAEFPPFAGALSAGGAVLGLNAGQAAGKLSRKKLDALRGVLGAGGAAVFPIKITDKPFAGGLGRGLTEEQQAGLRAALELQPGDLAVIVTAPALRAAQEGLGRLRLHMGAELGLVDETQHRFLWVTDFPLFEYSETDGRWASSHHPFTHPHADDLHLLDSEPGAVRSLAYDLVLDGCELGSGSVRIHDPALQSRIFSRLGIEPEEAQQRFGFFLDGLRFGTPPHAGLALGMDRLLMILCGGASIRDVIAFPKTTRAACLMSESPSPVHDAQLAELHVRTLKPAGDSE